MATKTHFTAVVTVTETIDTEAVHAQYAKDNVSANREVAEVGKIVVRADTLASLTQKVIAHVNLLDSDRPSAADYLSSPTAGRA